MPPREFAARLLRGQTFSLFPPRVIPSGVCRLFSPFVAPSATNAGTRSRGISLRPTRENTPGNTIPYCSERS